ncbi:MAG: protein translocase subunit SecF [Actinomycetota bacterium]
MNLQRAVSTFRGHTVPHFRIVQLRRRWAILSGTIIVLSLAGFLVRGINYSIDFTGGSQLLYANPAGATVEQVRGVLSAAPYDRGDAEVQVVGGNQLSIRTSALTDLSADDRTALVAALADQAGVTPEEVSQQVVGPTWGAQISRQALIGLAIVLVAITLYITLRFEWKMAIGAMIALVHDVLITAGVYALSGREVAPATVIAILTILGFSLYDTVVIYDKVKENTETASLLAKSTYEEVANDSMNQVFMRSVNTSLVVLLPIVSLLLFGGSTLKDFALAMLIGVSTGAYSSIFIATPILVVLKEREPRFVAQRQRLERERAGRPEGREPAAVGAATPAPAPVAGPTASPGGPASPPRGKPRKKPAKRRRR